MDPSFRLEFAAMTDAGKVRSHNEDAILCSAELGLAILADGMGGYNAGEVASKMAITVVHDVVASQRQTAGAELQLPQLIQLLDDAVQQSNTAILAAATDDPQCRGMGTTLVAALFCDVQLVLAHVGDSRCYRFRQRRLEPVTRDHSYLQEQIDAGLISPEWAQFSQNKNLITRAVGIDAVMDVEIHAYPVAAGDIYLLCSDGLSDLLSKQQMTDILVSCDSDLDLMAHALVQRANEAGGSDNISVILVRAQAGVSGQEGFVGRFLQWLT